ncbi:unnamed protein product [Rotaria sordida]|uniref:Uncharacterized protein n=1 Tax=Rotaria sordida TaxID=392033 RepID=A0A814CU12_9BILA|nr:unnamed protein product [Rotaria sordida]
MKTINIELDSTQREYLLDNCVHQLKNIELKYKDDNVKIQIRENLFYAPQYLASKIKQLINALVFQTATIIFQCIENACMMTTNEHLEIETIARKYNCQIDRIDVQTKNEVIKLPKARRTSTIKSTSIFIIQQSNRFIAALNMLKRLSTSTGGIEIHKTTDLTAPPVDITIISTVTDAVKEQIKPNCDNFYCETDTDEFSNRDWTILFIFDEKQYDMYDLFTQAISSLQTETNDYEQFYCPISTITIHLKTSRNYNIIKCQNAISDYLRKRIITTVEIDNAFVPEIWNHTLLETRKRLKM